MARLPLVRDHLERNVPTLRPESDILDAVEFLLRKQVTGAPVVDAAGALHGMSS